MKTFLMTLAASLLLAQASLATTIQYDVFFSGPNESPANASPGVGSGYVIMDDVAHTMTLHVDFSGLTGITTASHIHCCTANPGVLTAGVATTTPTFAGFPTGVTAGTYDAVLDMTLTASYNASYITANGGTTASAEAALALGMSEGKAYWNIHSSTFGGGEIRGFLTAATPEPGTIVLALGALAGIGLLRKQKRA